jgi:hypothetical protein
MKTLIILLLVTSCGKKFKGDVKVKVEAPTEYNATVYQKIDIAGMYNDLITICESSYGLDNPAYDECKVKSAQFIFDLNLDQGESLEN